MKKLFYTFLLFWGGFLIGVSAQSKGTVGFAYSLLNQHHQLRSAADESSVSVVGLGHFLLSADYCYPLGERLSLESGLSYSQHLYRAYTGSHSPAHATTVSYSLLSLPVGVRIGLGAYAFVNGGLLLDVMSEGGIGSYIGIGAKVDSEVGWGMYVQPYFNAHSLLPFAGYRSGVVQLLEVGMKIGVTYRLDNVLRYDGRGF